jgi:predicted HicB family RNase H-like nuclease
LISPSGVTVVLRRGVTALDKGFGHIAGIKDSVGFHGQSVSELKAAFEEAVEDYLEACHKIGKTPQKPYSGKLMLRLPPEIHAAVATAAELSGQSINQWASDALSREANL